MEELIRKQDALDVTMETVFVEYEDGDPRKEESIILQTKAAIRDGIKALPPVYVPDTNVGDMISRDAAVDALDVLCQEHRYRIPGKRETYSEYNEAWQDALDRAEGAIGNLPSAQPERTCVNCGRTANNGGWYADGRTRCPIEEHYALPKDGYCHLWEKRNVTDDDYPERREE